MWLIINIIMVVIGVGCIAYGEYIDSSENTAALTSLVFGIIFIVCSGISGLLLWLFG